MQIKELLQIRQPDTYTALTKEAAAGRVEQEAQASCGFVRRNDASQSEVKTHRTSLVSPVKEFTQAEIEELMRHGAWERGRRGAIRQIAWE